MYALVVAIYAVKSFSQYDEQCRRTHNFQHVPVRAREPAKDIYALVRAMVEGNVEALDASPPRSTGSAPSRMSLTRGRRSRASKRANRRLAVKDIRTSPAR